ncbi:YitT family protein [Croceicoccus mobilis]|uniref:Membrane protein n=1 Tax=Croceicoccus mobilis TaxID=1703339 RepID=A0A916YUQ5_9SPHN|nr:YitT family protein [Croceicoccus mobilis]GGD61463.1 membrane protein [Croceicoccus mobilis]
MHRSNETVTAEAVEHTPFNNGRRHSLAEDFYAITIGSSLIAFSVVMLKAAGLVTGGMAGVALLASYLVPLPATTLFIIINIPFFFLAACAMGRAFALKTLFANVAIMALGLVIPLGLSVEDVNPAFAALLGGWMAGLGILVLARHGAGVGGSGIVALVLMRSKGWNAGRTQMIGDVIILSAALLTLEITPWLISILSALAINSILMVNHRPGRYIGY